MASEILPFKTFNLREIRPDDTNKQTSCSLLIIAVVQWVDFARNPFVSGLSVKAPSDSQPAGAARAHLSRLSAASLADGLSPAVPGVLGPDTAGGRSPAAGG